MKRNNQQILIAFTLAFAAAGVLIWSTGTRAGAQEPNRQLSQTASANATGKRIALVIGNGAYTDAPPLKNPPNDARDMAATLKALGFDVTSGINVNQRDMKRLIREFGQKLKSGGSGLFYYAGHGVQSKGRNYLIPVDANIQSEAEVEDAGVDANLVLNYMDDAQNGLNIVILDACRNNPFSRSFRSASDGLAQVDAPTGTLIAYATAPGRVASDGAEQNGLYTSELLKQMRVPGLSVTDMFMHVRAQVMKQTGSKQVPWEASSLVGSFYFSGGPANSTTAANESKIDAGAFELSYWETIKNSQSVDDFKAYLEKYPNGQFASLARNRINSVEAPAKPADSRTAPTNNSATELAFWDSIKNSNNPGDYRAYLEKYPNGDFATLARNRLAPLEAAERSAAEPTRQDKVFKGYLGTMFPGFSGLGFSARPGQLTISPAGIQFIWDKGIEGIAGSRTDGLSGSKRVTDSRHPDPKPSQLQCSNFTQAKTEGFFIMEIGQLSLREALGGTGAIGRFRASSPAEAIAALAAVREACSNQSSTERPNEKGGSPGGQADEITRETKSFTGSYGAWSSLTLAHFVGDLVVSPGKIEFRPTDKSTYFDQTIKSSNAWFNHTPEGNAPLECSQFVKATVEKTFIREIGCGPDEGDKCRFQAESEATATRALDAIRQVCKSASQTSTRK